MASRPRTRKTTIAATFRAANQNSNSPKFLTAARLRAGEDHHEQQHPHPGSVTGNQAVHDVRGADAPRRPPPHTAAPVNIQPTVKPAQEPIERSACTENEPEAGLAAAISPSIRITSMTRRAGYRIGEHDRGAGGGDAFAGADEQARADHPAERDHREVALLEAVGERGAAVQACARDRVGCSRVGRRTRVSDSFVPVPVVRAERGDTAFSRGRDQGAAAARPPGPPRDSGSLRSCRRLNSGVLGEARSV